MNILYTRVSSIGQRPGVHGTEEEEHTVVIEHKYSEACLHCDIVHKFAGINLSYSPPGIQTMAIHPNNENGLGSPSPTSAPLIPIAIHYSTRVNPSETGLRATSRTKLQQSFSVSAFQGHPHFITA
jgi:hypothetical protein